MKIKKSYKFNEVDFVCEVCSTEFTAEAGEYKVVKYEKKRQLEFRAPIFGKIKTTWEYTPFLCFSHDCPQCRNTVEKIVQDGEPVIKKEEYWPD